MDRALVTQLRQIMREFNRREIWVNRYKKSQSVKCYSTGDSHWDTQLIIRLEQALASAGVAGTVRRGGRVPWIRDDTRSIIVSCPRTDLE